MSQEKFLNIARFFVYCECLECRGAMLSGKRHLHGFYNGVWPYVISAFTGDNDSSEDKVWIYACDRLAVYFEQLRQKLKYNGCPQISDLFKRIKSKSGFGKFRAVKRLYDDITKLDKNPCSFANSIEKKHVDDNDNRKFSVSDISAEDLCFLFENISVNMNLYHDVYQEFNRGFDINNNSPFPVSVIAGLYVSVSHLGRAVCHFYAGDDNNAQDEIRKMISHLERSVMDACKATLDYLVEHQNIMDKCGVETKFWEIAIEARKMEHDRSKFKDRVSKYNELHKYIKKVISYVKNNPEIILQNRK